MTGSIMAASGKRASYPRRIRNWLNMFIPCSRSESPMGKFEEPNPSGLTDFRMTEDFVIKYFWSACGYSLMSIPILFPAVKALKEGHSQVADRTESGLHKAQTDAGYVSNRRLLLSLADAGGRLMYSGKDLAELSGYTSRVYSLLASLHGLDNDIYPEHPHLLEGKFYDLANVNGRVIIGPDHVLLQGVPIVAPAGGAGAERGGEELLQSLDLRVEKGEHTLITGPK
jgi:ATP-binding cassette subfamily D (ALD) long-chain fatty acid import protein